MTTTEQIVQKGAMLHKLSVVDDKANSSLLGAFLDDTTGPPSKRILNHLYCKNEYEKDLPRVLALDSFSLIAYSKEKDYRRIQDFLGYLKARSKAAKVILDNVGTVAFLFPAPPTAEGIPCLNCYYGTEKKTATTGGLLVPPSPSTAASATAGASRKRPAPGTEDGLTTTTLPSPTAAAAAAAVKRAKVPPSQFRYIPPDAIPQNSIGGNGDHGKVKGGKPEGPAYDLERGGGMENGGSDDSIPLPALPDPSQFPRSKDPRFRYVPPTPPPGVEPPPSYYDPENCPVMETLSVVMGVLPPSGPAIPSASMLQPSTRDGRGGAGGDGGPPTTSSSAAWGKDQRVAEGFYNALKRDKGSRNQSLIFHMRKLNNWVKSQLINSLRPAEPTARELEVLDLACGKGGDFTKWRDLTRRFPIARYVGVDIAKTSLVDAIGRYHSDKNIRAALGSVLTLGCADLGATDLVYDDIEVWEATEDAWSARPLLEEDDQFDAITMQFALHYMFEEEARARHFFQLVAHHLRPGGSFIATTVDARVVIDMLAGLGVQDTGTNEWVARLVDEEQRELCRLAVDKETYDKIFRGDPAAPSPFCGLRYTFLLRDGTEEDGANAGDAVNAPEWLIPLPRLVDMAKMYGLELVVAQNFHEFVQANKDKIDGGPGGGRGIRWVNYQGNISQTEWDIARIYIALKFTRV